MKYGAWFITNGMVRRMVTLPDGRRSANNHPRALYSSIKAADLQSYVDRLNGRPNRKSEEAIRVKVAFLPTGLLEEFRAQLLADIPTQKDARLHYRNLHRYCLKWFVDVRGLKDPIEWKRAEGGWGVWLLSTGLSLKSLKGVLQTANKFMAFLHKQLPAEISFIKLEPLSKARLKAYEAARCLDATDGGRYITDADWALIAEKLPSDIRAAVMLSYCYGLRRAESLSLKLTDVHPNYLHVQRQAINTAIDGPLKSRLVRKTPHWFCTPLIATDLINQVVRMHPDTLGNKFAKLMLTAGLPYQLHDLRRTFITKALNVSNGNSMPVMWAVGHASSNTTMGYAMDDRGL